MKKIIPKILIVDDIEDNLMLLDNLLDELEVEIIWSKSGEDAIKKTNNDEFAIALIDVQMPDLDGYETVNLIRENKRNANLPIIFISAIFSDDIYKVKGIQTGAVDFISKPFNPEILIGKVKIFIDLYINKKKVENYKDHLEEMVETRTKQLKEAKERAEEADKLKTAFLTNMSHEIRTPMNAIVGFSDLLNMEGVEYEQINEYTGHIKDGVNYLLNLLDNLISISKLESGIVKPNEEEISLKDLFDSILAFYSELLKSQNISEVELTCKTPNDLVKVYSDKSFIVQIINNLIDNAIKFTNKGTIEFGYNTVDENTDSFLIIFVNDTGIGIPDDEQNTIFEKFRKIQLNQDKLYEGAGIGLAIIKRLVDLLNGKIELNSKIGKGTEFIVNIPIKKV